MVCLRQGVGQAYPLADPEDEKKGYKIHMDDLVVGDVVRIETGKTIPADAILIDGQDIQIDESALTGESDKLRKLVFPACLKEWQDLQAKCGEEIPKTAIPSPFLLAGTKVSCATTPQIIKGTGTYLLIVVGNESTEGKLKQLVDEGSDTDEKTPLQEKLSIVAADIGKIGLYCAIGTVVAMLISYFIARGTKGDWSTADVGLVFSYFVLGLTVLVVAIPEGLPLAVTVALAYSVMKMFEEQNFVKTLMVPVSFHLRLARPWARPTTSAPTRPAL